MKWSGIWTPTRRHFRLPFSDASGQKTDGYTRVSALSRPTKTRRKKDMEPCRCDKFLSGPRARRERGASKPRSNYGKGVKAVKNEPDSSINIPTSMTAASATGTTLYSLLSVSIGVADVRFYSRRSVIRLPGTHLGHVGWSGGIKTSR